MAAGVFDYISMASPEMAATVTADNIDILQENINSENLFGLISGNLETSGNLEITQNGNGKDNGNIAGIAIFDTVTIGGDVTMVQNNNDGAIGGFNLNNNATIEGDIEITQNGNDDAMGLYINSNATINGNITVTQNGNDGAKGLYIYGNAPINGDIEITQSNSSSATGIDIDGALKARNITITQKNCFGSENNILSLAGIMNFTPNPNLSGSIEAESITITQDTFNSGETATYYTGHSAEGITIDKIKAKQITIYQDAKPQEPYHTAHHVYGIYTHTSEIENAHITQLPLITGGYGSYALYGGQYNNVTIVSEAFVWPDISAHEGKSALGGDISITGTADITLINGAYLATGTDSNIFINNAVVNRQCSELYPSSKPDNITINNLTDNYTPCE